MEDTVMKAIDGTAEADAIILRRLTKCIEQSRHSNIGHKHYTDPRMTCPRCGINRLFRMEYVYDEAFNPQKLYDLRPAGIKVTLV